MTRDPDLLVVGGGILGLSVAFLAAERGLRVALWRLTDANRPEADSLRNLAWLHSGLAFSGNQGPMELSSQLKSAAKEMHDEFALGLEHEMGGIFRVPERLEERFKSNAELLKVEVDKLSPEDAARYLGPLAGGDSCYLVEDTLFDETKVLHQARERAFAAGVEIANHLEPVRLERTRRGGYKIFVPGRRTPIRPGNTLLAAGARLPRMLSTLGIDQLASYGTPLLCRRGTSWMRSTRLFHRYLGSQGLTVIRNSPEGLAGLDCDVIGARICSTVSDPDQRFAERGDIVQTIDQLPEALGSEFKSDRKRYTVTAAYKVGVKTRPKGCPQEEIWIKGPQELGFANLYAAFPGRATMGYRAARLTLQRIVGPSTAESTSGGPAPVRNGSRQASANQWREPIRMHYEYKGLEEERGEVVDG